MSYSNLCTDSFDGSGAIDGFRFVDGRFDMVVMFDWR